MEIQFQYHQSEIFTSFKRQPLSNLVPPPLFTALLVASDEPVLAKKIMTEMLYQTFLPRFPKEKWTVLRLPFESSNSAYDFDFNYRTKANARLRFLWVPKSFAVFSIWHFTLNGKIPRHSPPLVITCWLKSSTYLPSQWRALKTLSVTI